MPKPILYTFHGVGTGLLCGTPFTNAPFVISAFADASNPTNPINEYPQGALQVNCGQQRVVVAVLGLPPAVIQFGLSITRMSDAAHNQYWIAIGQDIDQLVKVNNHALQGYGLNAPTAMIQGAPVAPPSAQPYPVSQTESFSLGSLSRIAFQAVVSPG
jgi:hypothetical protein